MPYTTLKPCHIWHEEELREFDRPLCGEPAAKPAGAERHGEGSELIQLRYVRADLSAGRPESVAELVLWAEICRECAEHLADLTRLRTAPVQWLNGVGEARARDLYNGGIKTLADMAEYVHPGPRSWSKITASEVEECSMDRFDLARDGGFHHTVAHTLLNKLVNGEWRQKTPQGGDDKLLRMARETEVIQSCR